MIDLVNGNLITNHENLRKGFFNTAYIITAGKVVFNLKIGDSYPNLDKYSLNGHHVRGLNLKFYKGPFILDLIKGETKKAIQGDPANGAIIAETEYKSDSLIISLIYLGSCVPSASIVIIFLYFFLYP